MQKLQHFAKLHGKKVKLNHTKIIFHAGDQPQYFYWLEKGYVKIFHEGVNGQATTLSLFKPGEFFGMAELFSQRSIYLSSAIGLGEVTFYEISLEQLSKELEDDPSIWPAMTQVFAQKIIDGHEQIMQLTSLTVPERLAAFLQQYATVDCKNNLVVNLPLSHEEISYIINCSRQKVTSYLNLWRKEGLISYERGNIQIKKPDALFH